jgi:Resolvase, N terminal domain
VIDDDLGRSAAGTVQRAGFERMVAEVCLGKVGAVCAREVSRFARNSRDWQQLIEMCRVVDTVLVDHETNYAPRHGNDRLLLGLKGNLNEYHSSSDPPDLAVMEVDPTEVNHLGPIKIEGGRIVGDYEESRQA